MTPETSQHITELVADWWQPARHRALAELSRERDRLANDFSWAHPDETPREACERTVRALRRNRENRERVLSPGWLPERPKRKMPSLRAIAQFWARREPFAGHGIDVPACFGCGWELPCPEDAALSQRWQMASRYLERAHLVDHALGGLDGPQNIVPLCGDCHRVMPMFGIDQQDAAIAWVLDGGLTGVLKAEIAKLVPPRDYPVAGG